MKSFVWIFIIISMNCFANDGQDLERLIIEKKYSEVIEKLKDNSNLSWDDYYLKSIAFYHENNSNEAILNGVKSLILNPFSSDNLSNLSIFENNSLEYFIKIKNNSRLRFSMAILLILLIILTCFQLKNKRNVLILTSIQILLITFIRFYPAFTKIAEFQKITIQRDQGGNQIKMSPSIESNINTNFNNKDILFISRSLGDWFYVENFSGEPGWVNKSDLIL